VGTGPGGVGYADGSSSLELWLIADTGEAYTDVNCTADDDDTYVADEDGESVACWLDESGNGYNVTQATESLRPAFYWDQQNLKPAIRFVGGVGGDVLTRSFAPFSGDQAYHIFAAFTPSNTNGENLFAIGSPSNNQNIAYATYNNAVSGRELYHFNDDLEVSGTVTGWQFASFGYFKFGSGTDRYYYSNGALAGSNSSNALSLPTNPTLSVGGYSNRTEDPWGNEFTGDISEMIIFSQALPDVERILVENYLSARYAIDLPYGSDHYDGDTSTNGNFDLQVAGIGWYGSDLHRQAHAVGMIVRNATFLQSDGDWLLFGNNVAMNVPTTDNRPTDGDWAGKVNSRVWTRSFYIDVTDAASNGGTVDIIFDFSEGQMGSQPAGAVANYRLLKRTGSTGQFSDITSVSGATVVIAGDQVQFLGVNVNQLGSNFTLGTLDDNTSPTSVELVDLSARPASVPLAAPILLGAAAFLTGGILAFRKLRRR